MWIKSVTTLLAAGFSLSASGGVSFTNQIQLSQAHQLTLGSPTLTVAILSSGLNAELPALSSALALNLGESGQGHESDQLDNDQNGYTDDV